ncbi:MAG: CocE/NonD family hydrolase C-terminal non-catalytic domain-containing protein [bacterium]
MSGHQLMVSADIFRGRYRESYDEPKPLEPNQALAYTIPLPHLNHTFLPGHRLMVQVQSTWFPLYDRTNKYCLGEAKFDGFHEIAYGLNRGKLKPNTLMSPFENYTFTT